MCALQKQDGAVCQDEPGLRHARSVYLPSCTAKSKETVYEDLVISYNSFHIITPAVFEIKHKSVGASPKMFQ